jgi:hypothetical protein
MNENGSGIQPSDDLRGNSGFKRSRRLWPTFIVLVLIAGRIPTLHAQISPGPLARAHQSLSGDTNCTKCHEVSTRAPSFRCLECHREIAAELQQNSGLHATYPRSGPQGASCVKCHSDHNGVNFQMIHWDQRRLGSTTQKPDMRWTASMRE